jgi:hypothetical protein
MHYLFEEACSWKEGARCFPGSCPNTTYMVLDKDCKCAPGFGGKDCATGIRNKILYKSIDKDLN